MAHSDLLRKFADLAFDESAETPWRESQRTEPDKVDVAGVPGEESQNGLFESAGESVLIDEKILSERAEIGADWD
jgi:hypothetical protein